MVTRICLWLSGSSALRCFLLSVLFSSVAIISACGPNEGVLRSGSESPAPSNLTSAATTVERDVEDMRTAAFQFIYVVRRKDGGPIDAEDKSVIRVQTAVTNRRIASEDGKAFVIGSNREIDPEKMAALLTRFAVDDFSPPPAVEPGNVANANK